MKRKEFANCLLRKLGVGYPENVAVHLYSDTHSNKTKVLRIKMYSNPTTKSLEECNRILKKYLANVPEISKVEVRDTISPYIDFCIQVEYTGQLPDLDSPKTEVPDSEPTKESRTEGGLIRVETPFGVGYATDEADKARMMLWLEGVQAGISYVRKSEELFNSEYPEDQEQVDIEAMFRDELSDIEAKSPAEWWDEAEDILTSYKVTESITDEICYKQIMKDEFDNWVANN